MFECFPANYIWNPGVVATLNSGGTIDEVDRACRPIRELARRGSDVGTQEFMASWQITCAFLITHGENDRQIPVTYAHRSYELAVNASKRTLRIFTPNEGATEHVGLDHLPHVGAYTADWIQDTSAELEGQEA